MSLHRQKCSDDEDEDSESFDGMRIGDLLEDQIETPKSHLSLLTCGFNATESLLSSDEISHSDVNAHSDGYASCSSEDKQVESKVSMQDLLNNSIYVDQKDVLNKIKTNEKYRVSTGVNREKLRDIERREQYGEIKRDLSQWSATVKGMREEECLKFPLKDQIDRQTLLPASAESIVESFQPKYELEKAVEYILKKSGLEKKVEDYEDKMLTSMSPLEFKEYTRKLSKLRALTYYKDREYKRIKKIKSKKWHRIRRRSAKKNALTLEELKELDEASYRETVDKMDRDRIKERARIRHKNMNAWARYALKSKNGSMKSAVEEHLRLGRELVKKVSVDDSEDENDHSESESTREDDNDIIDINGQLIPEVSKKVSKFSQCSDSVSAMPFMQRRLTEDTEDLEDQSVKDNFQYHQKLSAKYSSDQSESEDECNVQVNHGHIEFGTSKKQKVDRNILDTSIVKDHKNPDATNTFTSAMESGLSVKGNVSSSVQLPSSNIRKVQINEKKVLLENKNYSIETKSNNNVFDMEKVGREDAEQKSFVRRAFANDDVMEEEFAEEKRAAISAAELGDIDDKYANLVMPGWGEWTGSGARISKRRKKAIESMQKEKQDRIDLLLAKRIDANISNVVLNETNVPFSRYQLDVTPEEFEKNSKIYDASMRHPLGKEWNTKVMHTSLIRPALKVQPGVSIQPLTSKKARMAHT